LAYFLPVEIGNAGEIRVDPYLILFLKELPINALIKYTVEEYKEISFIIF